MGLWRRLLGLLGGLIGGLFAAGHARAAPELPDNRAEMLLHYFTGGGVDAYGPAVLVRKTLFDKVALSGAYYMDAVSNASIDVVTTASPYNEVRHEFALSADYVYRDAQITFGLVTSHEPDYTANTGNLDVVQEVFSGMTAISLGFTRQADTVLKTGSPEFHDSASRWRYRIGATQILSPSWLMSANFEAIAEDGYLGSPYRVAIVFGAAVPERNPRTRSGRAVRFSVVGDLGLRAALKLSYRYFTDTWGIKSNTAEFGYSRYFGDAWLADAYLRYYTQTAAVFYSNNAMTETVYVSRNRQLSTYNNGAIGAKLAYRFMRVAGNYNLQLNGALEYTQFKFKDFTDLRTGNLYSYGSTVAQVFLTATY